MTSMSPSNPQSPTQTQNSKKLSSKHNYPFYHWLIKLTCKLNRSYTHDTWRTAKILISCFCVIIAVCHVAIQTTQNLNSVEIVKTSALINGIIAAGYKMVSSQQDVRKYGLVFSELPNMAAIAFVTSLINLSSVALIAIALIGLACEMHIFATLICLVNYGASFIMVFLSSISCNSDKRDFYSRQYYSSLMQNNPTEWQQKCLQLFRTWLTEAETGEENANFLFLHITNLLSKEAETGINVTTLVNIFTLLKLMYEQLGKKDMKRFWALCDRNIHIPKMNIKVLYALDYCLFALVNKNPITAERMIAMTYAKYKPYYGESFTRIAHSKLISLLVAKSNNMFSITSESNAIKITKAMCQPHVIELTNLVEDALDKTNILQRR